MGRIISVARVCAGGCKPAVELELCEGTSLSPGDPPAAMADTGNPSPVTVAGTGRPGHWQAREHWIGASANFGELHGASESTATGATRYGPGDDAAAAAIPGPAV